MEEALVEAKKALDAGEFPVGCVFTANNQIIARGHRQNSGADTLNELDHAEVVTLRTLLEKQPGFDCSAITVYSTMEPCLMCYATMLLSGIRRFVWAYEDIMGGGMGLQLGSLPSLYAEMQVERLGGVLRGEALALFQKFFRKYPYWQDSMLAQYTLSQEIQS